MTLPYMLPLRLRVTCKILTGFSLCLAIVYIIFVISTGGFGEFIDMKFEEIDEVNKKFVTPSSLKTFGLNITAFLVCSGNVLIFLAMTNVFFQMSKGHVFSLPTVTSIRMLGFAIVIDTVINFLSHPIMLALWTYDNPPGHRILSVSVNTHQGMMLLMGGLFMVIGHIYIECIRMAEENRQYV